MIRVRLVAALVTVAIIGLTIFRHSPAEIASPTSRAEFDGAAAFDTLRAFVADGAPRAVGSTGHLAARERLRMALVSLGCEVIEQPFMARGWSRTAVEMMNLLVRLRGTEAGSTRPAVLVSAHYDSVAAGPGAGDNAAGVACALEIIRALTASPTERDVIVLFPDGEEIGLHGARCFVTEHPMWKDVVGVVNLDARGSDGPIYVFEVGADGPAHAAMLSSVALPAHSTSLAAEAYRRMPNGTDFTMYSRGGSPGFNLAFIGSPRNYHTAQDTVENLDARTVNQLGQSALALVRALAARDSTMHTAAVMRPAVWFDVYGWFIVRWPAWLSDCAALGSLVWIGMALRIKRRMSAASVIGSLIGSLGVASGLALAITLGSLVSLALSRTTVVDFPWPAASIWWGDAILLLMGAVAMLVPSRIIARHRRTRRAPDCANSDAWFGGWLVMALLSLAVAYVAPGAVHPFLLPTICAALLTALALWRRWSTFDVCAVVTGSVAVLIWAPLEPALADAFGLSLGGVTALRGALVMIAFRPIFDGDPATSSGHAA